MDQIYYLTHYTTIENTVNIIKSRYLFTNIERIKKNIKYQGVASESISKYSDTDFKDEFPGIYMSYVTNTDIRKPIQTFGEVMLVFSKKLLKQKNYHCNIRDNNGHVSEDLTYFSFNLDEMPKQSDVIKFYQDIYGSYPGNEIIFHDKISISALCEIWVFNKETYDELTSKLRSKYSNLIKLKEKYPAKVNRSSKNIVIDTKSLPFLIDLDFITSGFYKAFYPYKTKFKSSKLHFKRIAKIAGISDRIINKYDLSNPEKLDNYLVKNKLYSYFHENRDKQHFIF